MKHTLFLILTKYQCKSLLYFKIIGNQNNTSSHEIMKKMKILEMEVKTRLTMFSGEENELFFLF